ncbi:MAG: carboxypeptidase regulatory-like domain-containing protein [Vicinamibacterales bacterium]
MQPGKRERTGAGIVGVVGFGLLLWAPGTAMAQTGTVTGKVTNAATTAPVTSGFVTLCTTAFCTSYAINGSGTYTATVAAGTYTLHTAVTGLVNEVFDHVPCAISCDVERAQGTPIVVGSGSVLTRNFALSPGGGVRALVTDRATGAPIPNVFVAVVGKFGGSTRSTLGQTDASGAVTIRGLLDGTYQAFTQQAAPPVYVNEILGGIPCLGTCSSSVAIASGASVPVTTGSVTNVTFALDRGATISGTVRSSATQLPVPGVTIFARARLGSELRQGWAATTDASGAYVLSGLPSGSYAVGTEFVPSFVDEVYRDRPCAAAVCQDQEAAAGDPVSVTAGAAVSGVDFALDAGGTITGRITQAGTGTPLQAAVSIQVVFGGVFVLDVARVNTNAQGVYSVTGLKPAAYIVVAEATGHAQELFGGTHLLSNDLDLKRAAPRVPVTNGVTTPNIDVVLDRTATITGRVRSATTNAGISGVHVGLFRDVPAPELVRSTTTDSTGAYSLNGFPSGTYYVATIDPRFDNRVWDGFPCPAGPCTAPFVVTHGITIPATGGSLYAGRDITLSPASGPPVQPKGLQAVNVGGGVQFSWLAPVGGGTPTSYRFEAGLTPGSTFASVSVPSTSLFVPGVPPGTYFIRVRGVSAGGTGEASEERVLRVGPGSIVAPDAPYNVEPAVIAGRLTLTWLPPDHGPRPTSYLLEVGTAAGLSNIGVLPVAANLFQFDGVPPGVYFVRLRSRVGSVAGPPTDDVLMVVGNVPAPPSSPQEFTSQVSGNVVTLTWNAPFFGPVTSYVLEAGTHTGAADIAVFNTGSTATSLVIPGVPPGRYFLRLRALNALGASPQGFEREVVVP